MKKHQPISECFHIAFEDAGYDSLLIALEKHSAGKYEDGIFTLSPSIGKGSIHTVEIEKGLYLRCFDFRPFIDIQFRSHLSKGSDHFYHLVFFLEKSNKAFSSEKMPPHFKIAGNSVFQPNNAGIEGNFKKGHSIKILDLIFTPSWMQQNRVIQEEHVKQFFESVHKDAEGSQLLNSLEIFDYNAARNVHAGILSKEGATLKTRINSLLLINRFFASIATRKLLRPINSSHFSDIVKIEAHVREHLDSGLPKLKSLAVQFHMSASTLKRHFKAVYGKNIYEYYLEKKMDLAKNLLEKEGLSISEVAYTLGYEKAGSLTAAFKKVHGLLPRELKNCL